MPLLPSIELSPFRTEPPCHIFCEEREIFMVGHILRSQDYRNEAPSRIGEASPSHLAHVVYYLGLGVRHLESVVLDEDVIVSKKYHYFTRVELLSLQ